MRKKVKHGNTLQFISPDQCSYNLFMYYVKTLPPLKKREYFLRCHQKNSCILFGKSQKAAKMVSKGFRIVAVQNPAADAK